MTLVTSHCPLGLGLVAALWLAACSASSEPAAVSPAPIPSPTDDRAGDAKPTKQDTGGIGAPKIPWADKNRKQRMEYMGIYVLPKMEELFKQWNPDEFGEANSFRCQNCHGENFDKPPNDFEMPRVAFPLSAEDPLGGAMKYDPVAAVFMSERVLPTMIELLGAKPYDPATGEGFGCLSCHPAKPAKSAK